MLKRVLLLCPFYIAQLVDAIKRPRMTDVVSQLKGKPPRPNEQ